MLSSENDPAENGRELVKFTDEELIGFLLFGQGVGYKPECVQAVLQIRQSRATNRLTKVGIILTIALTLATVVQAWAAYRGVSQLMPTQSQHP